MCSYVRVRVRVRVCVRVRVRACVCVCATGAARAGVAVDTGVRVLPLAQPPRGPAARGEGGGGGGGGRRGESPQSPRVDPLLAGLRRQRGAHRGRRASRGDGCQPPGRPLRDAGAA
eukprot:4368672-Pyramimonas_sp.AAC.1